MRKRNRNRRPSNCSRNLSPGARTTLDRDTPLGLFESTEGNRYVIARHVDCNLVIALRHKTLPRYTWQELTTEPLDLGRWWGAFRLRLTHAMSGEYFGNEHGIAAIGERRAAILCQSLSGDTYWRGLGRVGEVGLRYCDFDGWIIEGIDVHFPFFKRKPGGATSVGRVGDAKVVEAPLLDIRFETAFEPYFEESPLED